MGLYAPYTILNNYFVSDDSIHFYLVHSYAVIENPVKYEYIVSKIFNMLSSFVTVDETQNSFLNPIAKILHNTFQLYENPTSLFKFFFGITLKEIGVNNNNNDYNNNINNNDYNIDNNNNDDNNDNRIAITLIGYNAFEVTYFLSILAHTHVTNVNSTNLEKSKYNVF